MHGRLPKTIAEITRAILRSAKGAPGLDASVHVRDELQLPSRPINKAYLLVANLPGQDGTIATVFAHKIVLVRTSAAACCSMNKMTRWN